MSSTPEQDQQSKKTHQAHTSTIFLDGSFPQILPKLIVFDLDNTLWTPELYQLNRRLRKRNIASPRAYKDINLFSDAVTILSDIVDCAEQYKYELNEENTNIKMEGMKLAVASRTTYYDWAYSLLDQFSISPKISNSDTLPLSKLFPFVQIVKGSKIHHFQQLKQETNIPYNEMLFFDDDMRMNLKEISSQLGVLCCHCPNGITVDLFRESLLEYSAMKQKGPANLFMGYILTESSLGIASSTPENHGTLHEGTVKFYSPAKKYGFIRNSKGSDFFVHESKIPRGVHLQKGMKVKFEEIVDGSGRSSASILEITSSSISTTKTDPVHHPTEETIDMPCFSMSQPFASLLLNKIKDIETRNNPMFENMKPDTSILLHCGKRDWHDLEAPVLELKKAGYSSSEIAKHSSLPPGFRKGNIIGILKLGRTWLSTERERRGENMQKRVVARTEYIGKYCTIIEDAKWMKKPFTTAKGKPGIFNVKIPKSYLE